MALSVGIDIYDNLPALEQLQKAVNDARAMAEILTELGFETMLEKNVPRLGFMRAWQTFLNQLKPGDTAAVFFAGHGVEINGLNYLLPRDVPKVEVGQDRLLAGAAVRLNELMEDLREKRVRVSMLIIDACRTNPFRDGTGRSVGGTRGLGRIEAAKGSFVMYSAGEGEEALDRLPGGGDASPNSIYTRTLLPILKTPGLSLPEIATRVRDEVVEIAHRAGREQTPAYYDRLVGKLVLRAGAKTDAKAAGAPASEAAEAWAAVKDGASIAELEMVANRYKGTVYADLAKARIGDLRKQQPQLALAEPPAQAPARKPEPPVTFDPSRAPAPLTAAEEQVLKPKDSFKECADCPEMVVVPAGSFVMGSPKVEKGREPDEDPQHRVTIARPLAVGKFEVTFAEWDACVAAGGCTHRPGDEGWGRGKRPVINVSWDDITKQYLPWLSGKTGKTYRLLSEAEWEYVARAGTTTPFWWGSSISTSQANYGGPRGEPRRRTVPVDSFAPNPWGLYNVHGNVWEFMQDCWNASYNGAPSDGSPWMAGDCATKVLRGGAWDFLLGEPRSADRSTGSGRDALLGFRVARML